MEYAEYLSRKLSIAVALAVLKEKPSEMSTSEYIVHLQNEIKSRKDEQCMDIDQVSVTSQDFEDVIEDTEMTPVEDILSNKTLLLPCTSNVAKTTAENRSSKIFFQSTFIANDQQPVSVSGSDCDDNMFVSQECGQNFNLYTQESVSHGPPIDHKSNENGNEANISKENNIKLNVSRRDDVTNKMQGTDDQVPAVFYFGQSQTDLFLTQTQTDLRGLQNAEKLTPQSNARIQNNVEIPVQSNAEPAKQQDFTVLPQAHIVQEILLNLEPILPDPSLLLSQIQSPIVAVQSQEKNELPIETADTAPSQTQSTRLELLSQAIVSEAIEIDSGDEADVKTGYDEPERGVSFKVLQELENINEILRELELKPEERVQSGLPDSGYRSDSQLSSSQLSMTIAERLEGGQLAQSTRTLIEHVCECPARALRGGAATRAGCALGRLATAALARGARPAFLDTLLRHARDLLDAMWEDGEAEPLSKDESVFRLMLLTECPDIATCTIDHLLDRLDAFHKALTADPDAPYEIDNIGVVEGHCYSFHVLELLLRGYLTKNESGSAKEETLKVLQEAVQETTPIPKNLPASISDIWRKRWDPSHKPVEVEAMKMKEKKDILERCGEVLNKFIVGCMDKYGLISFAALECFNCLQS